MSYSPKGLARLLSKTPKQLPARELLVISRLEQLPTELKLQILGYLSFEELTEIRSLNILFRELIETKAHHSYFSPEELSCSSIIRLNRFVQDIIESSHHWLFEDALNQFFRRRGIRLDESALSSDIQEICAWLGFYSARDHFLRSKNAGLRVGLYIHYHLAQESESESGVDMERIRKFADHLISPGPLFSRRQCWAWKLKTWKIKREQSGGTFDWTIKNFDDDTLSRPLTPASCLHSNKPELRGRAEGICKAHQLYSYFGVPELGSQFFAYYVRSEWAYEKLKDFFEKKGNGKDYDLTAMERLKIVREMFIC